MERIYGTGIEFWSTTSSTTKATNYYFDIIFDNKKERYQFGKKENKNTISKQIHASLMQNKFEYPLRILSKTENVGREFLESLGQSLRKKLNLEEKLYPEKILLEQMDNATNKFYNPSSH